MNQRQKRIVANILERFRKPNLGSVPRTSGQSEINAAIDLLNSHGMQVVPDLYMTTWVTPALEYITQDTESQKLAERLSRP